jgi:hypothetical protein
MSWLRLVLIVLPAVVLVAPGTSPTAAWAEPAGGSAVQAFGACLSARLSGDLLLVIDQSGSLRDTDPTGVRVTAAQHLLTQLIRTTAATGATLDVAIAGFDMGFTPVAGWTRLTDGSLADLNGRVDGFRGRNTGVDTDYVAAIEGIQQQFRGRHDNDPRSCRAAVWFTDGKFDIEQRRTDAQRKRYGITKPYAPGVRITDPAGVQQALDAGRTTLCRAGGVADQLRATGVLLLAAGLGPPGSSDFRFLQSVATGTDGAGGSCGRPPTEVVGDFRHASDLDDVLFAFDAISDPSRPPTLTEAGVCPHEPCTTETRSFVLDTAVRSVHILAAANVPGVQFVIQAPTGASATFGNGSAAVTPNTLGGGRLTARWLSERTLDLTLDRSTNEGWTGQWSVVFVDPTGTRAGTRGRTQIRITGDLRPALEDTVELRTGAVTSVRFGLVSEVTGDRVRVADLPGTAALTAQVIASDGVTRNVAAALDAPVPIDLTGMATGAATIRLTLAVRTADIPATQTAPPVAGTQLADRVVDLPVDILPPLNFPHVTGRLQFRGEGAGPFDGHLTVHGPGCVWVDGATTTAAPDGVGTVEVAGTGARNAGSCLAVTAGGSTVLPIRLRLQNAGNGTVAGTVTVHLAPDGDTGRAVTTTVPYLADVVKPAEAAVRLGVLIAALLLGLGGPTAFLYLAKWWTARIPGRPLLTGTVAATVSGGVVARGGQPFIVTHDDVDFAAGLPSGGTRRLDLASGRLTLRTRAGLGPGAAGYTMATANRGWVMTGGPQTSAGGKRSARLPLAVHNNWVAVSANPARDDVEIHLMVPSGATPETFRAMSERIRTHLPAVLDRLRQRSDRSDRGGPNRGGRSDRGGRSRMGRGGRANGGYGASITTSPVPTTAPPRPDWWSQ